MGDGRAKQSLSTPVYLDINFGIDRKWGDTGAHFIIAWTWLFSLLFMYYFKGMCDAHTHYSNCQQFRWKPSQTKPSQPNSNTKDSIAYLFICFIFRIGHNIKIHCAFPIDYLYIFCGTFRYKKLSSSISRFKVLPKLSHYSYYFVYLINRYWRTTLFYLWHFYEIKMFKVHKIHPSKT